MKPMIFGSPRIKKFFIAVILALGQLTGAQAQDLLVNPKRVVFEGNQRIQELNVANIGKDTARYVISFIQIRMKTDGSFEEISVPDSGQYFADKHLRVFPRTITLAPNEAQVVKVQTSGTSRLPKGEYRSHMYFRSLSTPVPLGERPAEPASGVSIRITPVFGLSIPVIIRREDPAAAVRLSGLNFANESGVPAIGFRISRTGDRSVYGDLKVEHISAEGKVTEVSSVKGVAVYTPNEYRDVRLALKTGGPSYRTGKLRVTYTDAESDGKKELASADILLK